MRSRCEQARWCPRDSLRLAGIWEASLVSSMLPWKGLGTSKATAHTARAIQLPCAESVMARAHWALAWLMMAVQDVGDG